MPILLVIDDEPHIRYSLRKVFEGDKGEVLTAATAAEGLALVRARNPEVILLDLQLPDGNGLDVFQEIHALDPKRPVIFITAHGTTNSAIEAMKGGAFDYLVKPLDLEHLTQVLDRAIEAARLMNTPAVLPDEPDTDRIVGRSKVIQEMCKLIGRIAPQDVNVLILGESGTGKELVARALYHHSRRADRPFMPINCAAIPESLLESELFGHEAGAFTGAQRRRIGKFEQCNDGTLFFDEIGDMSLAVQVKLLRVLQEQRFERLGSNETVQTQVRVLAATNQDLAKLVEEGQFRKDLYFRLQMVVIQVPPLRERLDDVAELAHYFLFRFNHELGLDLRGFAPVALDLLQGYSWPGNVRELQGMIKQAMFKASGHLLLAEFLPDQLRGVPSLAEAAPAPSAFDLPALIESMLQRREPDLHKKVMDVVERVLLTRVLRATHGHQANASELLGLHRATLRQKLRALGLAVDKVLIDNPPGDEADM
ncbi:Fis family transcriptional regulator [Planctomycetaceae bacterium SCGC AG-212-F19]|nr:Fis family transcriptional regulator [Planctomycetaceae bacterium SCGC AG-212-F19]